MSALSARMAATALRLLTKYGQPVTLVQKNTGAYDPTTSTAVEANVLFYGFGMSLAEPTGEIDGTMVVSGNKTILLSIQTAVPQPSDSLIINGVNYSINTVLTMNPDGTTIMYEIAVRVGT